MNIQNILILEDQELILEAFVAGLTEAYPKTVNIHTASSLAEAQSLIKQHKIDLALLDIHLPDGQGIELLETLGKAPHNCYSVMITADDDSKLIFQCLRSGAKGYLLKTEAMPMIMYQLQGILEDTPPFSPSISREILNFFHNTTTSKKDHSLTVREVDILSLLAQGMSCPKIAEELTLSPHTIADYIKRIYQKLNISSRAEATRAAINLGLS